MDPFMSWVSNQVQSNPASVSVGSLGPSEIQFNRLEILRPIGEGSFGRVYAANLDGEAVAVKVLLDTSAGRVADPLAANSMLHMSSPILAKLNTEVSIMQTLTHPNVVKFVAVCSVPPCIVTELCARGSLCDLLKEAAGAPELAAQLTMQRRLAMAIDAAEGLAYLHSQSPPIVHRDLKSPNLLVAQDWTVKVTAA